MALIIEDGSGVDGAESYASVAEADDYLSRWHGSTEWGALDEAAKERALRNGTRYVDSFRLSLPAGTIPEAVKTATIESALRFGRGEDLLPDHDGAKIAAESKGVGSVSKSTQYATPKSTGAKRVETVRVLLRPYIAQTRLNRTIA